jgi:hypothetical protein
MLPTSYQISWKYFQYFLRSNMRMDTAAPR